MRLLCFIFAASQHTNFYLSSGGDPSRFESLPDIPVVDDPSLNAQLNTARQQSQQFLSRLEQIAVRLESSRATLKLREQIAVDMKPAPENGAMSRNQYLLQLNQVQETRVEVSTLEERNDLELLVRLLLSLNQIDRQMIRIRAELVGLKETISYRTVRAPVNGKVFDVKVSPQVVAKRRSSRF